MVNLWAIIKEITTIASVMGFNLWNWRNMLIEYFCNNYTGFSPLHLYVNSLHLYMIIILINFHKLIIYSLGQWRYPYSSARLTATNTKYNKNIVKPRPLFIFHLKQAMLMITKINMAKRRTMLQTMPEELTLTGSPLMMPNSSQGNGNLRTKAFN